MNRYPLWKYAMIGIILLVALLYTLPNFFGEVPAVQVSPVRATLKADEALLARVRDHGERLRELLRELPGVVHVRGVGLMVAIDVAGDAPALARRALLEERLVINATGPRTLRFLPPLVVDAEQVDDAVSRLRRLMTE